MKNITDEAKHDEEAALMKIFEKTLSQIWEEALRFSLDLQHAPERCKRRSGETCRMKWAEGQRLSCGGGVSEDAVRTASALALFGTFMIMRERFGPDV